ncbi:hypothetical protein Aduo_008765 [Ancylostoma duodenale]
MASFLAQQNHEKPISLVEFGQAYILDLNELKSLHEKASTADQRVVIEALIGVELLNLHRDEILTELQSALTNLQGPCPHSPFGVADPTAMFRYDRAGRFSKLALVKENVDCVCLELLCKTLADPIDFNAEYEEFRFKSMSVATRKCELL